MIDVTASNSICKGPVVLLGPNFHGLELDSPAEIHMQFQEKISLTQTKVLANMACRCYTFFSEAWDSGSL